MARKRYQKGHVFQAGSTWFGKYREDVIGPEGNSIRRQVTVSLGSKKDIPTKPLALRRMEQVLARINAVDYRPGRFAKMEEFAERWREQVLVGQKPSARVSAESHLRTHILPHFGKYSLDQIGTEAQQVFLTRLARANLSRKTALNIMSTLSSILSTARAWGYVCEPVRYESLVHPCEEVEAHARFFTLEQLGKILAAAREPYKTMFMVLAMTALRAGEMLGLQWEDVDFDNRCIHIRRSAWYGRIQTVKNRASEATIPLPTALATSLASYRESWKPNPQGFLFVTRNIRPPSSNKVVEYGLWPVLDLLGIPRCGLHAFRHTYTSLLLQSGATPKGPGEDRPT